MPNHKTLFVGLVAAGLSLAIAGCATYTGQTQAPDDPNRSKYDPTANSAQARPARGG